MPALVDHKSNDHIPITEQLSEAIDKQDESIIECMQQAKTDKMCATEDMLHSK